MLLESLRFVDLVIPEENWEQKVTDVKEYHVDTFVMGDDWQGKFDFLKDYQVEDILYYSGEWQHRVEVLLKDGSIIYLESEPWG